MQTNLAVVTPEETSLFSQLAEFHNNERTAREMNGLPMTFDRIKHPSSGGTSFEVPAIEGDDTETVKTFSGVILYHHPIQSYYKKTYTGGKEKPDCASMDGEFGRGNPGGECAACPLNKFGTGVNGSKACKEKHRLYLLKKGEIFPMILDLPTTSVREFGGYVKRLLSRGIFVDTVITKFALRKTQSTTGMEFSQVVFSMEERLGSGDTLLLSDLAEQARVYAQTLAFVDEEEPDTIPAACEQETYAAIPGYMDRETGEIYEAPPQE